MIDRARRRAGLDVLLRAVGDGARLPLAEPELDAGDGVNADRRQQHEAREPEHALVRVEEVRVAVDDRAAHVDLQVSQQMGDDVQEEDDPGERHQHLLADVAHPEEGEAGRAWADDHVFRGDAHALGLLPAAGMDAVSEGLRAAGAHN